MIKKPQCSECGADIESSKQYVMVGKCVSCEANDVFQNEKVGKNNLVYTENELKKTGARK